MEIRPILSSLRRSKTGAVLIAAQVALTLAILSNAAFVVRDRLALSARPTGAVEPEVFVIRVLAFRPPPDLQHMQEEDSRALAAIPGVKSVAWTNQVPLGRSGWTTGMAADRNQTEAVPTALYFSPDSLVETLGLELIEGRDFTPDDVVLVDPSRESPEPEVAIVTHELARRLFPDGGPYVGRTIYQGTGDDAPAARIVGVVELLYQPWARPPGREGEISVILPERHLSEVASYFVRTDATARDQVMAQAEELLTSRIDGRLLIENRGLEEVRARYFRSHRALAGMLSAVSVLLLLVTASGIVGMASLWVNQRRKQIGVRRALGALRRDVVRYFLVENFLVTSVGLLAGVALALGLNEILVRELEMSRLPWVYLVLGVASLWFLGLAAAFGPAWRASLISPAIATRSA
jgi:putative ABC transport system permease protein